MSYFHPIEDEIRMSILYAQQVADQRNTDNFAVYRQRHRDWLEYGHEGDPPAVPGTWIVTVFSAEIGGVIYTVPNHEPEYRADQPLCDPLPIPEKADISGVPKIGNPMGPNPKGNRRIIGRIHEGDDGAIASIVIDGETVRYRLATYEMPTGHGFFGGYWEPAPEGE